MRTNEKVLEFNVDAYTARLIGRENVSKLEGAVLEIVKNAYDADAKVFCLYYTNSQDCIYIMDNGCNGVQREHNKKLNNGLPILHKVPPKRDYGRYFCIMAEKGGTSHGGLTEKLSPFFYAQKQEVNAYGR